MFKISTESNLPLALKKLDAVSEDKWPKLLRYATVETGFAVVAKVKKEMPNYIDRPRPFTINSLYVQKPKGANVDASVEFKTSSNSTSAGHYLVPMTEGGARKQKRFESALTRAGLVPKGMVAIPGKDAELDQHGNVPGSVITKILSYVRANPDAMQNRRVDKLKKMGARKFLSQAAKTAYNYDKTAKREERAKARRAQYFVHIKGRGTLTLASGIYEREKDFGFGGKENRGFRGKLKQIFAFVPVATYRKTFPFYEMCQEVTARKFPEKIDEALKKALK